MTNKLYMILLALFTTCCAAHPKQVSSVNPEQLTSATVALEGFSEGDDDEGVHHQITRTYCSGVWVGEDLILTAHHCAVAGAIFAASSDIEEQMMLNMLIELQVMHAKTLGVPIKYSVNSEMGDVKEDPKTTHKAAVIAIDEKHDLALIKTDRNHPKHLTATISYDKPEVGSTVSAVGHPLGYTYTYVQGKVSAYRNDKKDDTYDFLGPFLQLDMSIAGGMSGGGVFNSDGQLVGIISMSMEHSHQGIAIPSASIKAIVKGYI